MTAVVMGVSGSGKTPVAALVAKALGWQFQEGDALHPSASVEKMRGGAPLANRLPWLRRIAGKIDDWRARGESGLITCSALKRCYGEIVVGDRSDATLVYLRGSHDLVRRRMAARQGHFMPVEWLNSQFEAFREPTPDEHPIVVDVGGRPADISGEILRQLDARRGRPGGDDSAALTARPSKPSVGEPA
jgi:gluconokinase